MTRGLASGFLLLAASGLAIGQTDPTIKLTTQPAAAPSPALRYQLLPDVRVRLPGNAAQLYYRAFSPEWTAYRKPEVRKLLDKWAEDKKQLPDKELRWIVDSKQLQEVDRAARRQYCDWEMEPRLREDGINFLLPDVHSFREFAQLLSVRAHFEIGDGSYDKAMYTLQTGLSLGRDASDAPTLIQVLVGAAVSTTMLGEVEALIQAPNSPNLYWALTDLPRPFLNLRRGFQGERLSMEGMFPGMREALAQARSAPLSNEQAQSFADKLIPVIAMDVGEGARVRDQEAKAKKAIAAAAVKMYPEAKKYLAAHGWNAQQIEAMPKLQVMLLYQVGEYDRLYDEMLKWQGLPYWEARVGLQQAEKLLKEDKVKSASVGFSLASLLIPAAAKVTLAGVRLDRRIAALRCVEAVRLYAAAHDGKLPAKLDDIKEVPIPLDPFTGKPFEYKAEGDQVTIEGAAPEGEKASQNNFIRYEVTIKR